MASLPTTARSGLTLRPLPIVYWCILQIAALAIAAAAVPLWAHHPQPRESLAVHILVSIQIVASALLWPMLLPTLGTSLVNTLLVWPFVQFAGLMTDLPQTRLLAASAFVSLWIAGLGLLSQAIRPNGAVRFATAVTATGVLGGVVLAYLRAEAIQQPNSAAFGPLLGGLHVVQSGDFSALNWIEAAVPLLVALAFFFMRRHRPLLASATDLSH